MNTSPPMMPPLPAAQPQPVKQPLPAELHRWNWGAFWLNWVWGLGNNTPRALMCFIPIYGIYETFLLGKNGNQWAWQNKSWASVEQFKQTQRNWAIAGWALLLASVLFILLMVGVVFAVLSSMKSSEPYQEAVEALHANPQAMQVLGQPVRTGLPSGSISSENTSGNAELSFSVNGPNGSGKVYTTSQRQFGRWQAQQTVFEDASSGEYIDLLSP